MVQRGRLRVVHIPGTEQLADVLTKQLPVDKFKDLIFKFGMKEARK